ncbi:MAG: 2-phospho-L-lactate guanylyltransferase [bacterium]|nr:2-phospho-L-lactate guanylyltransferase [bacterium]
MSVWVIIPIKPLTKAKTRLAAVLSPEQRAQLAELLMRHTISVVNPIAEVAGTLVISRDPKALSIARDMGVHTVQESGTPELNHALMRATQVAIGFRGEAVLILPADLPLIQSDDVSAMLALGRADNTLVIATDRHEDGTNAMLTRPAGMIPYAYGPGSFQRHMEAARAAGAAVQRIHNERLMLDIDMPDDLQNYMTVAAKSGADVPAFLLPNSAG